MITQHIERIYIHAKALADDHSKDPAGVVDESIHPSRLRHHIQQLMLLLPEHNKKARLRRSDADPLTPRKR